MNIRAVDLFCGVGGLTHGLEQSGIEVVAGIDVEESCRIPHEVNNNSNFILKDIKELSSQEVEALYPDDTDIKVLVGCAPCQPFSSYSYRYKGTGISETKMDLLGYFGKLVENILPDIVSMENVPQMVNNPVFEDFVDVLKRNGYEVDCQVIYAPDYEIPQNRKRLVLVASRMAEISIIPPLRNKSNYVTVRDVIGSLPSIKAGEFDGKDPLHTSRNLSLLNLKRIKQSRPGGTWKDWDPDLLPNCYRKESGQTYKSVYGRIEWDKPSPTITTQFIGYGNGRFGHPEQDRALSLREGAMLQTFPKNYKFSEGKPVSMDKISTQIGNAVPVKLGFVIGKSILNSIQNHN